MTNRKVQYWVIPPKAGAEFVAHMEEVLETYGKLNDPACPVLCMDEQPVQLIGATADPPKRVEYERAGTANIFMFTEPLSGWRDATARASKTKVDWPLEIENASRRDCRMVGRRQRNSTRRRRADEDRRPPLKTQVRLSKNQAVTKHSWCISRILRTFFADHVTLNPLILPIARDVASPCGLPRRDRPPVRSGRFPIQSQAHRGDAAIRSR